MKTFLDAWLLAVTTILRRDLAIGIELVAAEYLPATENSAYLGISIGDDAGGGQFSVVADLPALHGLLVEAGLVGSEPDRQGDYELWRGLLSEAANAASRAYGGVEASLIDGVESPPGVSYAAYELRLGNAYMRLGFADGVPARAVFQEAVSAMHSETSTKDARPGVDLLLDVELETSIRFGSREMSLNEVLELGPGDVVELDRHIADPVDLLVGDKIVASGEVVLVNGNFGLRVLEVAEPRKCLESIRCLF